MTNTTPTPKPEYPALVRRFQASFIDGIITFALVGGLMVAANHIDENNDWLKIGALVIGLSYEPLMNYFFCTVGQHITGQRVVRADGKAGKPTLLHQYLRYVVKGGLGWVSFLTIHSNSKRQAIHDFAGGTVVVRR